MNTQKSMILLVDDNEGDVALMLRALKKNHIESEVVVTRDGVAALDYLFGSGDYAGRDLRELPRVVLLDLRMPKMDGLEVLRRIRADPRTKLLPVVMLTTSAEDRDVISSYNLGVNSFVRKPVDFNEFSEAVRELGLNWIGLNVSPPQSGA